MQQLSKVWFDTPLPSYKVKVHTVQQQLQSTIRLKAVCSARAVTNHYYYYYHGDYREVLLFTSHEKTNTNIYM